MEVTSHMEEDNRAMEPLPMLVLVEIGFRDEQTEQAFHEVSPQMERELAAIPGCLESRVYRGPDRRYLFFTVWEDRRAIQRWVDNAFHRSVLMANFSRWADEGWFSYWNMLQDNSRARKCMSCGRWTRGQPGWSARGPTTCVHCGASLK
jgi:heme-degrading monooxygenase HmoA